MSLNLNKVIIAGRMTETPELKMTQNSVPVIEFSVAVSRDGKDSATDFIKVVAWRGTAEFVSKYFFKGSAILVIGKMQVRSYKDSQSVTRYVTEVIADEVKFVESKAASHPAESAAENTQSEAQFVEVPNSEDLPF